MGLRCEMWLWNRRTTYEIQLIQAQVGLGLRRGPARLCGGQGPFVARVVGVHIPIGKIQRSQDAAAAGSNQLQRAGSFDADGPPYMPATTRLSTSTNRQNHCSLRSVYPSFNRHAAMQSAAAGCPNRWALRKELRASRVLGDEQARRVRPLRNQPLA